MAKISKDENLKNQPEVQATQDGGMNVIIERLEKLERENQALKEAQEHPMKKARERYQGPRAYSYKLWGGVPVLGFETVKKDESKDLLYKDSYGNLQSNHYLKLSLANGKSVKVEVNEFNASFTRSEKLFPKNVLSDGQRDTGYVFENEEFGEFTVLPSVIN